MIGAGNCGERRKLWKQTVAYRIEGYAGDDMNQLLLVVVTSEYVAAEYGIPFS